MKDFRGRVMMVTGAASGIGRATALAFADEGCDLVVCDINEPDLIKTADEISARGRRALPVKADVSKEKDVKALAEQAFAEFGKVDIAMSNAGTAVVGSTHRLERTDWDKVMGVNFYGTVHVIRYFVPPMVKRRDGHLVVTASGMGLVSFPFVATYTASKFALVGLTEVLRSELAYHNVGVTTLCPAFVRTPIFEKADMKSVSLDVKKMMAYAGGMSPERFARIVIKGVKRNKGIMPIHGLTKTLYGMKRLSPALYQTILKGEARLNRLIMKPEE